MDKTIEGTLRTFEYGFTFEYTHENGYYIKNNCDLIYPYGNGKIFNSMLAFCIADDLMFEDFDSLNVWDNIIRVVKKNKSIFKRKEK